MSWKNWQMTSIKSTSLIPYAALVKDGVLDGQYAYSNGGLNGRGYLKWAEVLVRLSMLALNHWVLHPMIYVFPQNARQQLYTLKTGQVQEPIRLWLLLIFAGTDQAAAVVYNPETTTGYKQLRMMQPIPAETALLHFALATSAEYWYSCRHRCKMPTVFRKEIQRNGCYLRSWKQLGEPAGSSLPRGDNTYNIINRKDVLLSECRLQHKIKTSATEPAAGWSFRKADSFSKSYHQWNCGLIWPVRIHYLTGTGNSGNDITDTGCQYLITEVTASPRWRASRYACPPAETDRY